MLLALILTLPDALLNRPYVAELRPQRVSARCPIVANSYRITGGVLPPGMELSPRGDLEGTPTEPGTFAFEVEIFDGCFRRSESRRIRVIPAPILTAEAAMQEFHCPVGTPAYSAGIVRISGSALGRAYSVDILNGTWLRASM